VHGIRGLRVIDASVILTVLTGNTNAPAAMIGECVARFVLKG
jgi:choline dehydrogenase-like flavoprotein